MTFVDTASTRYHIPAGRLDAEIKAVKDTGEFEAILSVPTLDRDGEIVDAGCFNPLPDHIPIDVDHGMSVTSTVGSGQPFYEGDALMFRGTFASTALAQEVRTLVTEGHVRKMSVAYRASRYETDETDGLPHLRSAELLNAAIVAIPSNRQADILSAKSALEALGQKADAQHIHDRAVELGATCHESATDPEKTAAAPAAAVSPAEVTRALVDLASTEAALAL